MAKTIFMKKLSPSLQNRNFRFFDELHNVVYIFDELLFTLENEVKFFVVLAFCLECAQG